MHYSKIMYPTPLDNYIDDADDHVKAYLVTGLPFTNWSFHKVKIWGYNFATAEHAYQYKKFCDTDADFAQRIRLAPSPLKAKQIAWTRRINSDEWDEKRRAIMKEILIAKYRQHDDVRQALSQTKDCAIVQKNTDSDTYWGIGVQKTGQNIMGKLWMSLR